MPPVPSKSHPSENASVDHSNHVLTKQGRNAGSGDRSVIRTSCKQVCWSSIECAQIVRGL